MSKVQKQPLSKVIGQWDNGYVNTPKIDYTMDQLERAFRACQKYKKLLNSDQLRIVLRGSPKKNSANADLVDIDVHAVFMGNIKVLTVNTGKRTSAEKYSARTIFSAYRWFFPIM